MTDQFSFPMDDPRWVSHPCDFAKGDKLRLISNAYNEFHNEGDIYTFHDVITNSDTKVPFVLIKEETGKECYWSSCCYSDFERVE